MHLCLIFLISVLCLRQSLTLFRVFFRVPSLTDFVGSLPIELLLCLVRALRVFLRSTSSLSPPPRTLFVSPRCPSRSLSKNALSFFLRCVILQSLPSPTPASLPSSASSSASGPSTSFSLGAVQFESAPGFFFGSGSGCGCSCIVGFF